MNARLLAKVLRRRAALPTGGLSLLGEGVDAILVRMRFGGSVAPASPSPEERLVRYYRARGIFVTSRRDLMLLSLRAMTGTAYQLAWSKGTRPPLNTCPPVDVPTSSRRAGTTPHWRTP